MRLFGLRLGRVCAVFLERAGQREFAELVAHHVFGDEHRVKDFAVVNGERQADEIRRDGRTPRPGLDRRLLVGRLRLLDFVQQAEINKRTLFNRTSHKNYLFFIGSPFLCTTMKRLEDLYFARVLPPLATKPHGETSCCQPPPPLDLP